MMMAIQVAQSMLRDAAVRESVHAIQSEAASSSSTRAGSPSAPPSWRPISRAAQDDLGGRHRRRRQSGAARPAHSTDGFRPPRSAGPSALEL